MGGAQWVGLVANNCLTNDYPPLVDLCMGITVGTINHDTKLNWLEVR